MKNSIEIEIPEMGKIKFESLRDTNNGMVFTKMQKKYIKDL